MLRKDSVAFDLGMVTKFLAVRLATDSTATLFVPACCFHSKHNKNTQDISQSMRDRIMSEMINEEASHRSDHVSIILAHASCEG